MSLKTKGFSRKTEAFI